MTYIPQMEITPLNQLEPSVRERLLLRCNVETSGEVLGKVSSLITDKYNKLIGLEFNSNHGDSSFVIPIPSDWIEGVDKSRKVIQINVPLNSKSDIGVKDFCFISYIYRVIFH